MSHLEWIGLGFCLLILILLFLPEIQSCWEFLTSFDRADKTEMEEESDEFPCL